MANIGKFAVLLLCFVYLPNMALAFFKRYHQSHSTPKRSFGETAGAHKRSGMDKHKLFFRGPHLDPVTVGAKRGSLVLECSAGGIPGPTIHWLKDGERITQGDVHTSHDDSAYYEDHTSDTGPSVFRLAQTMSRLYLDCLTDRAEGVYTCVAETPMLRKTQSTKVQVEKRDMMIFEDVDECSGRRSSRRGGAARIYMWSASRLEFEGTKVQLYCRAEGTPSPQITWYDPSDNVITEDNDNYRIARNGDLIIREIAFMEHMGQFTCEASNGYGTDAVETFLYPMKREEDDFMFGLGL